MAEPAITGPRWRGLSLGALAERIGVSRNALRRAADNDRIAVSRRRGGVAYVTQGEARRFVASPACWVLQRPQDIVCPDLRARALDAWEAAGRPVLYAPYDLMCHYHVARHTVARWRLRGWPRPDAWHWHGDADGTSGAAWLVWVGALPPPPEPTPRGPVRKRRGYTHPTRRAISAPKRAAVVAAVEALGGPPGRGGPHGRPSFWDAVAELTGLNVNYARCLWQQHRKRLGNA